jgi:hypothetical protein
VKVQAGVRVEGEVWGAFKVVCKSEEVREGAMVEGFLNVVLECGSALSVLHMLRRAVRAGVEGFDDYARVLLNWYRGGRRSVYMDGREVMVDGALLLALKAVSDSRLRGEIREALVEKQVDRATKLYDVEEAPVAKEEPMVEEGEMVPEGGLPAVSKTLRDFAKNVVGQKLGPEEADLALKQIKEVRRKLKLGRRSKT